MREYLHKIGTAVRKGDWVLLLRCIITTAFGCLVIASATQYLNSFRYIGMQIVAACIGILCFAIMASVDAEFWLEHRLVLIIFNFFILALVVFFIVKGLNKLSEIGKKKEEEAAAAEPPAPPAPSNEEVLLGEIRDLLKNK